MSGVSQQSQNPREPRRRQLIVWSERWTRPPAPGEVMAEHGRRGRSFALHSWAAAAWTCWKSLISSPSPRGGRGEGAGSKSQPPSSSELRPSFCCCDAPRRTKKKLRIEATRSQPFPLPTVTSRPIAAQRGGRGGGEEEVGRGGGVRDTSWSPTPNQGSLSSCSSFTYFPSLPGSLCAPDPSLPVPAKEFLQNRKKQRK